SIVLFVRGKPFWAIACACLGATVHSTYLLPAALLTLAYMTALLREGRPRRALALGGVALVLVVPVVAYVLLAFRPTDADTFAEAQHILARFRIPHHALAHLWCDAIAVAQIAWVVLALCLIPGGFSRSCPLTPGARLFHVLAVVFILSAALTLLQIAT